MIGIDSPVSIDSFKIQEPFKRMQSHGTVQSSLTSIKSPGTIDFELNCYLLLLIVLFTMISLFYTIISF